MGSDLGSASNIFGKLYTTNIVDDATDVTISSDLSITGDVSIADSKFLEFGALAGGDLAITHNTTDGVIKNYTGNLYVWNSNTSKKVIARLGTATSATQFHVETNVGGELFVVRGDGQVESGTILPFADSTYTLGSSSFHWSDIRTDKITGPNEAAGLTVSVIGSNPIDFETNTVTRMTLDTALNVNVNIIPTTNGVRELGSSSFGWRNVFLRDVTASPTIEIQCDSDTGSDTSVIFNDRKSGSGSNITVAGDYIVGRWKSTYQQNGGNKTAGTIEARVKIASSTVKDGQKLVYVMGTGFADASDTYVMEPEMFRPASTTPINSGAAENTNAIVDLGHADATWANLYMTAGSSIIVPGAFTIDCSGGSFTDINVLLSGATALSEFKVQNTDGDDVFKTNGDGISTIYSVTSTAGDDALRVNSDVGGSETNNLKIYADGDVENTNNSYGALSDRKIKENIRDSRSYWDDMKKIKIRRYNLKKFASDGSQDHIGVVAQELEEDNIFTSLVKVKDDEENPGEEIRSVRTSIFIFILLKTVQELISKLENNETQITALQTTNTTQQAQIDSLLARVLALEANHP